MKLDRPTIALAGIVTGVAGILAIYALPWVATTTSAGTTFATFADIKAAAAAPGTSAFDGLSLALSFAFHGFLWGTVAFAVAYAGLMLRPIQRHVGESFAVLGSVAVVSAVFFALATTFFFMHLARFNATLPSTSNAWYGVNYVTPIVGVAFVAIAARHAMLALPSAAEALRGEPRAIPISQPIVPAAPPSPPMLLARAEGESAGEAEAAAQPADGALEAARRRAHERVAAAREHARRIAARAPGQPAMTTWAGQIEAYLDNASTRIDTAQAPATLAKVERELEEHVFRHG